LLFDYIDSDRPAVAPHAVRLDSFDANGACDCPHFQMRYRPGLETGEIHGRARCKHIVKMRRQVINLLVQELSKRGHA
jgi:hypothetical protein